MKKLLLTLLCMVTFGIYAKADVLTINVNTTDLGKNNTSYVTTAFDFTKDGITFNTNQVNPSTGQVKVNAGSTTSASGNFYLYNKTALPNISEITITMKAGSAIASNKNTLTSIRTADAAITTSSLGKDKGDINGTTLTFKPSNTTQSFFRIDLAKIGGTVKFEKIEITYGEVGPSKNDAGIAYSAETAIVTLGEEPYELPTLANPNNLDVTYSSTNTAVATIAEDGSVTIGGAGTTTIKASTAETDEFKVGEASYTLTVKRVLAEGEFEETITPSNFGIKDATGSYQEFSYTSPTSNVSYKVFAYPGNDRFQLRTDGDNSGFVVTENPDGLIAVAATFEWNTSTGNDRKVAFYGLHKAYTAAADLYKTPGTELAIKAKANEYDTSLDVSGEYNFIGLKSTSGALYLNSITITWVPANEVEQPVVTGYEDGKQLIEGDQITFEAKPGQHIYVADEVLGQHSMMRAANIEGWAATDTHKHTLTVTPDHFGKIIKVKATNGAGTKESEPIMFGITSDGTTTGVEAIEAEITEGEVEWFNLQGVRVANPANGLYIRRQGNTVSKVLVK